MPSGAIYIYDANKAKDEYNSSTHAVAEYISSYLKYAGEFLNALDPHGQGFDELPEPIRLTTTDQIGISNNHKFRKEWREKVTRRKTLSNLSRLCLDKAHPVLETSLS